MKIIECPWELDNLDCRVAEINVDVNEMVDEVAITSLEKDHDYLVLKLEAGNMQQTIAATRMGYVLAETQLTVQMTKKDWNIEQNKITQMILSQSKVERIRTNADLDDLFSLITDHMFTTDRVYLDPNFGPTYSSRRYKNWTRTEFERGSLLYKHYFRGQYIGFSLSKLSDGVLHCLLAGTFEKFQKTGIGFWIPLIPLLYQNVDYNKYTTCISANNYPVWQMYNAQHYTVSHFDYVFVKHIKH